MQSNVSRRSFFKGAGLAALGGLSAAALSGCGHGYAAEEPANLSTGDFGGPSWLVLSMRNWGNSSKDACCRRESMTPMSSRTLCGLPWHCHKIHENQVLVCNECHDLTLPEGWEAPHAE